MGKRILTFFMGFLFGIVALVGGVAGVGFWAYKNLDLATLEKWGWVDTSQALEADSDLKNLSVEGWIREMTQMAAGAEDTSVDALVTRYKIKLPENIRKYIPDAAMTIPIKKLTQADGLDTILANTDLDYVFGFLSEGALSPYLERALGSKSLKTVLDGDISALTEGLYVGYLLDGIEFETDAAGNVTFTEVTIGSGAEAHTVRRPNVVRREGADAALEALATLEVKRLYDGLSDTAGVGLLGVLAEDVGDRALTDLIPADPSEALIDTLIGGKTIADLIVKSADTGKYEISAGALTEGVYVGALMGYAQGAQKTDAAGLPVTDESGNPRYHWTTERDGAATAVTGIEDSLANILLSDLTQGGFSIAGAVDGLYIGEVMGYVQGDAKAADPQAAAKYDWYAKNADGTRGAQVTGIEEAIANLALTELLNGGFSIETTLAGMYVGEIMKYEKGEQLAGGDPATVRYQWFAQDGDRRVRVEGMEEAVANILLTDLMTGNFRIEGSFEGMYVGELMKYVKGDAKPSADPQAAAKYDWYAKNADGTRGAQVSGIEEAVANIAVTDLLSGGFDAQKIFSGMYVGEIMGYVKDGLQEGSGDYYWKNGETRVGALNAAIANIAMSELLNGTFDAGAMIDKLTLGDVMGYTLAGGVWTDASGAPVGGIIGALAGKTVAEIPAAIDAIAVGEVMEMKLIDGVWYGADAQGNYTVAASGIMKVFADLTVGELQNSDTLTQKLQNDLTLADALGYTEQNGVFYDADGRRVTGIMSALAAKKVGELSSSVNTIQLGVVLGYTERDGVWYGADAQGDYTVPATGVVKALAGTRIDGLDAALETLEIGKIMGMEFRAPSADPGGAAVWCREESAGVWVPADALTVKFAAKRLNELSGDTFREIVDGLTVNDIFTGEKTGILQLLKDDPATAPDESNPSVTELPNVLADSVTNATMGDLVTVGIITEGAGGMAETLSSISAKLYRTESDPAGYWKTRTMAQFFADVNALLAAVPNV